VLRSFSFFLLLLLLLRRKEGGVFQTSESELSRLAREGIRDQKFSQSNPIGYFFLSLLRARFSPRKEETESRTSLSLCESFAANSTNAQPSLR